VENRDHNKKISGILLAAGESSRLGQPKQLLKFNNQYLINHMIKIIKSGGIDDLNVVVGAYREQIVRVITSLNVKVVVNDAWKDGIGSSFREGVRCIAKETEAVMIFVVDQPYLDPYIIRKIINLFNISNAKIIASRVKGEQIHPVLYKREIFDKILNLKTGQSGKNIMNFIPPVWMNFTNDSLLIDIDTAVDYRHLIKNQYCQSDIQ